MYSNMYAHMDVNTHSNMSLEDIHIAIEKLAVEGFVGDIIEKTKDIYNSLYSLSGVKQDHALKDLIKNINNNVEWLRKYEYKQTGQHEVNSVIPVVIDELGKVDMVVPPGFKGDLLGYSVYLCKLGNELNIIVPEKIEKFTTLVSHYITNTEYQHKKLVLKSDYDELNKFVDNEKKNISKFFYNGGGLKDTLKYRELINTYREMLELADNIKSLSKSIPFSTVMVVDSMITKLATVLDMATEASKDERFDKELLRTTLSEYTLALARLCELYSLTRFRIETCVKMYDNLVEVLIKKL